MKKFHWLSLTKWLFWNSILTHTKIVSKSEVAGAAKERVWPGFKPRAYHTRCEHTIWTYHIVRNIIPSFIPCPHFQGHTHLRPPRTADVEFFEHVQPDTKISTAAKCHLEGKCKTYGSNASGFWLHISDLNSYLTTCIYGTFPVHVTFNSHWRADRSASWMCLSVWARVSDRERGSRFQSQSCWYFISPMTYNGSE